LATRHLLCSRDRNDSSVSLGQSGLPIPTSGVVDVVVVIQHGIEGRAQPPTILMICPTPMQRALLSLTRLRMIAATSARFPTSRFAKPISAFS